MKIPLQAAAAAITLLATPAVHAQCEGSWTVHYANSASSTDTYDSEGLVMSGSVAIGFVGSRAAAWPEPSGAWQDITPVGVASASVRGVAQGYFVGSYSPTASSSTRACRWGIGSSSIVSLHNSSWTSSVALGGGGVQQAGFYQLSSSGGYRACMWNGTAGSFVDLHPPGALSSVANGTNGLQQIGSAVTGVSMARALLWSGSTASVVDLTPSIAANAWGQAIYGSQQVGQVQLLEDLSTHAALWFGSRESFVDLNPPGSEHSHIMATCGSFQVGQARVNGVNSAYLWRSSPIGGVDLQSLTVGFTGSRAEGVSLVGDDIYVCGWGNTFAGRHRAVIWVYRNGADCDNDGVSNQCAIQAGAPDFNGDGIPDSCQCVADIFTDGQVDGGDLGGLLAQWGPASPTTVSDLNHDGQVNGADLGYLLSQWGPCGN